MNKLITIICLSFYLLPNSSEQILIMKKTLDSIRNNNPAITAYEAYELAEAHMKNNNSNFQSNNNKSNNKLYTYYYTLTKKVENGKETILSNGGQFISFTSKGACYDSDKDGFSVNNGVLKLTSNSDLYLKYKGESYWGEATYTFSKDQNILNVITNNNIVYVYKKADPPSGVETSSLIKKKESSSGGAVMTPYVPPSQGYSPPSVVIGGNSSQPEKQVREIKTRETCSRCGGKRRIVYNTYPTMFGTQDHPVRCSECGETHLRSVGHSHITCPDCNGRGYKERTSYKYE